MKENSGWGEIRSSNEMHCSAYLGLQLDWLTSLTPTFELDSDEIFGCHSAKGSGSAECNIYIEKGKGRQTGRSDSNTGDEEMREGDTHRESVSVYALPLLR